MSRNSVPDQSYLNLLCPFLILAFSLGVYCFSSELVSVSASDYDDDGGGATISSFNYAQTLLRPYDWRYIRVNLPVWFSSMSITLESDVNIDPKNIRNFSSGTVPMICFREGSPPLPDVYNTSLTGLVLDYVSNSSFGGILGLQVVEQCYPMQKRIYVRLTNQQISPGVWYIGLFNGIGPMRTQSKMINRGQSYSFNGNVSVEGCITPMVSGQFCNETLNPLKCVDSYSSVQGMFGNNTLNQVAENTVVCRNADEGTCFADNRPKIFSLNLVGFSEMLIITISNVTLNQPKSSNSSNNASGIIFMCYARHGAIPLYTLYDYSGNISILLPIL